MRSIIEKATLWRSRKLINKHHMYFPTKVCKKNVKEKKIKEDIQKSDISINIQMEFFPKQLYEEFCDGPAKPSQAQPNATALLSASLQSGPLQWWKDRCVRGRTLSWISGSRRYCVAQRLLFMQYRKSHQKVKASPLAWNGQISLQEDFVHSGG